MKTVLIKNEAPEAKADSQLNFQPPEGHCGYCAAVGGKILQRHRFYMTAKAESAGGIVMTYDDARKRGHKFGHLVTSVKIVKYNVKKKDGKKQTFFSVNHGDEVISNRHESKQDAIDSVPSI